MVVGEVLPDWVVSLQSAGGGGREMKITVILQTTGLAVSQVWKCSTVFFSFPLATLALIRFEHEPTK